MTSEAASTRARSVQEASRHRAHVDDEVCINTIRTLAIDAVQKANSGHPGAPMALAPAAYVLWQEFLRYDPADPLWPNRDRFVLSAGHASMLLYAMLRWNVVWVTDANDRAQIRNALTAFRRTQDRPTLVILDSIIGYGAPHKQNTAAAHSDALGEEEVRLAKRSYGWPEEAQFLVPDGVYDRFRDGLGKRGGALSHTWQTKFEAYRRGHSDLAAQIDQLLSGALPQGWDRELPSFPTSEKGMATRDASGKVLNAIAERIPWLLGGAADLAPSTKTLLSFEGAGNLEPGQPGGRNLHFGVREHAMGAVVSGLVLSHLRAFGATFLIFSDYMRPPMRLAALMQLPVFYVFTHDSIGLGEDGPTHQPVEQLAALRAIPHMIVLRPADANEVREAYRVIMDLERQPASLVLSRQALPVFDRSRYRSASGLARGAYVMADPEKGEPQVILIGTGSEVQLCVHVYEQLRHEGIGARIVSMPSWRLFEQQDEAYRASVLPPHITARVAVEQAAPLGWDRYAGASGAIIAMRDFGASAPFKDLQKKLGFTPERVMEAARSQIAKSQIDKAQTARTQHQ